MDQRFKSAIRRVILKKLPDFKVITTDRQMKEFPLDESKESLLQTPAKTQVNFAG